jgi:hypothetical protein
MSSKYSRCSYELRGLLPFHLAKILATSPRVTEMNFGHSSSPFLAGYPRERIVDRDHHGLVRFIESWPERQNVSHLIALKAKQSVEFPVRKNEPSTAARRHSRTTSRSSLVKSTSDVVKFAPIVLLDSLRLKSAEHRCLPQSLIGGQKDLTLWRIFAPVQCRRKLQRVGSPQVITIHKLCRSGPQRVRRLDNKPLVG